MSERKWWAKPTKPNSVRNDTLYGPFSTWNEAIEACFDAQPECVECLNGYGATGPFFDLRWTPRNLWDPQP